MKNPQSSTRTPNLSREEEAVLTLQSTRVSRRTAWMLSLIFLFLIALPPAVHHFSTSPAQASEEKNFWSLFPSWRDISRVTGVRSALLLLPNPHETIDFEKKLEREAWLSKTLISAAQSIVTGVFDSGNERVSIGRDKWLFLKAEIDYLTGKGFLDKAVLQQAVKKEIQPDPLVTILDLDRQLKQRGIKLIVMPIPAKATIHPEHFTASANRISFATPENISFKHFTRELQTQGVLVYDAAPTLLRAKRLTNQPQYLPFDTHWTPQAMTRVARDLATFITDQGILPQRPAARHTTQEREETNLCDLEMMLKLPKEQNIFPRTTVKTSRIFNSQRKLWRPQLDADILLLGDSFTNIYSKGGYWGHAAGLGEHLSFYLQRPIDRIAVNGGGAAMNRVQWISNVRSGKRDLSKVRVVVLEFATRTLLNNDWKRLTLPPPSLDSQ